MNEIIKGMANAAEAIQENFEEQGERLETVEQKVDLVNLMDSVSWNDSLTLTSRYIAKLDNLLIIHLQARDADTPIPSETVIGTLPANLRPRSTRYLPMWSTSVAGQVIIDDSGNIIVYPFSNVYLLRISGVIPLNL